MKKLLFWTLLVLALVAFQCAPEAPPPVTRPPEGPTATATLAPSPTPPSTPQYGERYSATLAASPTPPSTPTEDPRERVETVTKELRAVDPAQATQDDVRDAFKWAGEAQKLGLDELAEELLDWAKEAITSWGEEALKKDPCQATLEDVREAIEVAAEAQKVPGLDDLANRLFAWAQDGFRSYAAGRVAAGADARERVQLAEQAQRLLMDELAEDLMAGEPIASGCEEEWEGILHSADETDPASTMHVEFTFTVDKEGRVIGKGTGTYVSPFKLEIVLGVGDSCVEYVENPIEVHQVVGSKIGENFQLKLMWKFLAEKGGCGIPPTFAAETTGGMIGMLWWFPVIIPAQDGAQVDCSMGWGPCSVQIWRR